MNNTVKATLAALVSNAIFGFSFLFSKLALDHAEPSILLSIRFITAFTLMNLLLLSGKQKISFRNKPVGKLLLMGLIQPVIYYVCETNGIAMTTASFSGVMIGLIPVAGLILGVIFLKERCTTLQVLFTLLSVVGVGLTTTGGFGSISSWFSPFERTYVITAMGTAVFTGMALVQNRTDPGAWLRPLSHGGFWTAVLYLAVASSVCAFLLYNYAVNHLSAGRTLIMSNFSTVVSVVAGILILKDAFAPLQLLGIVLILVSVFGVSWQSGKQVEHK